MPNNRYTGDNPAGEPNTGLDSYDERTRNDAVAEHNRRLAQASVGYGEDRLRAADNAATILERERLLRGHSIAQAANATGLTETRYRSLEEQWSTAVSPQEAGALKRYSCGLSADTLLSDNDPNGRHKAAMERVL